LNEAKTTQVADKSTNQVGQAILCLEGRVADQGKINIKQTFS